MDTPEACADGPIEDAQATPAVLILPRQTLEREDLQQAIKNIRGHGFSLDIHATDSADDTRRLVNDFGRKTDHTMIAGGGDGMLNVFAQSMQEHNLRGCTIGILPLGTGNDFAAAAGISDADLETALRIAIAGKPCPVDLAFVNDRPFLNVVTIGQTAEFSMEADPEIKEKFGKWAYVLSAIKKIGESQCSRVHLQAGGLHWSGSVFGVMVGNGRQAGGGFIMSKDALVDDGRLNGLVIPEMPMRQAAMLAYDLKHDAAKLQLEHLPIFNAAKIKISFENEQTMQIDGEGAKARDFVFRVDPMRMKVRLPQTSPIVGH